MTGNRAVVPGDPDSRPTIVHSSRWSERNEPSESRSAMLRSAMQREGEVAALAPQIRARAESCSRFKDSSGSCSRAGVAAMRSRSRIPSDTQSANLELVRLQLDLFNLIADGNPAPAIAAAPVANPLQQLQQAQDSGDVAAKSTLSAPDAMVTVKTSRARPRRAIRSTPAEAQTESAAPPSLSGNAGGNRLLDVRAAAAWLGLSKSTLDKLRCSGGGPPFIRPTSRAIRYDVGDLDAFARDRRHRSTSENASNLHTNPR